MSMAGNGRHTEALRQQAVVAALFAPHRAAARALVAGAGVGGTPRALEAGLVAYRGNGLAVAERSLQAMYPVTFDLLGESAGSAAAHLWRSEPPRSGDLADWGAGLADWLQARPSLSDWPQLAGCARIERALHQAERAVDAALDPDSLRHLGRPGDEWVRLRLKPGVAVLRCPAGSYETWREAVRAPCAGEAEEAVLVWREGLAPRVEPLTPKWAAWLDSAVAGCSLHDLLADPPEPDAETTFAHLISRGCLLGIVPFPAVQPREEST
jgi:hypothetical protein